MKSITRRDFTKTSIATGLAMTVNPFSRALGANDDIRVALVGLNGKGLHHSAMFSQVPGVRIAAICDVDTDCIDFVVQAYAKENKKVQTYTDVRKLLENKDIDAISIATPNHWHSLMTVWGCQAGKDVYVEKPVSHNVFEGRKAVQAARKYNRIVQSGTQSRSCLGLRQGFDYIHQGNLGKIKLVRGICYKMRKSIGKVDGPQPIPATVDYDLWTGPAERQPLMRKQLHNHWHYIWNTGNGEMGNMGVHELDLCRWVLGYDSLPPRVISMGGRFGCIDDGQTPNTQLTIFDYDSVPIIHEIRGLPRRAGDSGMDYYRSLQGGLVVHCENGYFSAGYGGGAVFDNDGKKIKIFSEQGAEYHVQNFVDAMRSRKSSDLRADILEGHASSALCHLANISYRLGKESSPEKINESIGVNKDAAETFERLTEHLAANNIDIEKTRPALGPWLKVDAKNERFIGDCSISQHANELLTRQYREPFVVPENV